MFFLSFLFLVFIFLFLLCTVFFIFRADPPPPLPPPMSCFCEFLRHRRVLLLDQRAAGRSSHSLFHPDHNSAVPPTFSINLAGRRHGDSSDLTLTFFWRICDVFSWRGEGFPAAEGQLSVSVQMFFILNLLFLYFIFSELVDAGILRLSEEKRKNKSEQLLLIFLYISFPHFVNDLRGVF